MTRYKEQIIELKPVDLEETDLLPLTEAAQRLNISINTLTGLLQRGKLRRIVDTTEPNLTRAGRVVRAEVEAEIERRKRSKDTRLKQGRGRKGKKAKQAG